jgi:hypothetical protein
MDESSSDHSSTSPNVTHESHALLANVDHKTKRTLIRYLQDLPDADKPPTSALAQASNKQQNSKSSNGKPKLVLMGQRRYVSLYKYCIIIFLMISTGAANLQYRALFSISFRQLILCTSKPQRESRKSRCSKLRPFCERFQR